MIPFSYYYVGIAVAMAIVVALQMVMWGLTAERQVHAMRKAFFKSILRQEMAWFDMNDSGELNTRLSEYVILYKFTHSYIFSDVCSLYAFSIRCLGYMDLLHGKV